MYRDFFPQYNKIVKDDFELILDSKRKYKNFIDSKPNGFWMGLKSSWFDFWHYPSDDKEVLKKTKNLIKNERLYEIILNNDNNIYIKERYTEKINEKDQKIFLVETIDDINYITENYTIREIPTLSLINWKLFSERYSGIEIRNYLENKNQLTKTNKKTDPFLTKNYLWYLLIDVDCVCIWSNLDFFIKEVKKVVL